VLWRRGDVLIASFPSKGKTTPSQQNAQPERETENPGFGPIGYGRNHIRTEQLELKGNSPQSAFKRIRIWLGIYQKAKARVTKKKSNGNYVLQLKAGLQPFRKEVEPTAKGGKDGRQNLCSAQYQKNRGRTSRVVRFGEKGKGDWLRTSPSGTQSQRPIDS